MKVLVALIAGFAAAWAYAQMPSEAIKTALAKPVMNLDSYLRLIEEKNPKTVEEALDLLPPEFRAKYVIMYDSKSLQGASKENPRIIIRGSAAAGYDDSFLLTFNGSSSQERGNAIELMQFRKGSNKFEMREVTFNGSGHTTSDPNPGDCVKCHSADPRPIWEAYLLWPGALGGDDDSLHTSEKTILEDLEKNRSAHSRYSKLPKYDATPKMEEQLDRKGRFVVGPLLDFTRGIFNNNTKRLARKVSRPSKLWPFRFAILGNMLGCETLTFQKFFPKEWIQASPRSIGDLYAANVTNQRENYKAKNAEMNRLAPLDGIEYSRATDFANRNEYSESGTTFSNFQFIGEMANESFDDWSTTRYTGAGTFNVGDPTSQYLVMLEALWDPADGPIDKFRFASNDPGARYAPDKDRFEDICEDLVDLSVETLEKITPESLRALSCKGDGKPPSASPIAALEADLKRIDAKFELESVPKEFQLCAQCHQGSSRNAPLIRFDLQKDLLSKRETILKRMSLASQETRAMPPAHAVATTRYLQENRMSLDAMRAAIIRYFDQNKNATEKK